MSPLALFQQAFLNPILSLIQQNPGTLVLIVPHVRDLLTSHAVFPQGVGDGDFGNLPSVRRFCASRMEKKLETYSHFVNSSPSKCFRIHACFLLTVFGSVYQLWMSYTTLKTSNIFSDVNNHYLMRQIALYNRLRKTRWQTSVDMY